MKIELYKSALCHRCAYVTHILNHLKDEFSDLELISYDIATDFQAFKSADIRMIPALRIDNVKRSWILPQASQIRDFILKCRDTTLYPGIAKDVNKRLLEYNESDKGVKYTKTHRL